MAKITYTGLRVKAAGVVNAVQGQSNCLPYLEDSMKSKKLVLAIYGDGFSHD